MTESSSFSHLRDALTGRPATEVLTDMARVVEAAGSFLVTAHVNPDGDAVGSQVAVVKAFRALGKEAVAVSLEPLPSRYKTFVPNGLLEHADAGWLASSRGKFDWCVVLDASEPGRLGDLRQVVFADGQKRLCIDHHVYEGQGHVHEGRGLYEHHLVVPEAPATGNLVLAFIDALHVQLDRDMARALWLAVSSDTGWFRFSNTSPMALQNASRLLAVGLDPEALYSEVYGSHSLGRTRLLGGILSTLTSAHDGRFVWGYVTRKDLEGAGVPIAELDGVIDHIKSVRGAEATALVTEIGDSSFKVSLRSTGAVTVESVARGFGGGGHAKAAGFRYEGTLEQLQEDLYRAVAVAFADPKDRRAV